MGTAKSQTIETPSRPLIQIDDLVREMNEEEFAAYEEALANLPQMPEIPES
jgi:hypothetical protein